MKKFEVGGQRRTYDLHLPPDYGAVELPLVMLMHGGGGNARTVEYVSQMSELADKEGFIVCYPNGYGRTETTVFYSWNTQFCCGFATQDQSNDLLFLKELTHHLLEEYLVDRSQVFAAGISNGGMMAHWLGAEMSGSYAAVGVIAGAIGGSPAEGRQEIQVNDPLGPVSVVLIHGKQDSVVPYKGGLGKPGQFHSVRSFEDSILFWVTHNQCSLVPVTEELAGGAVVRRTYTGGEEGTEVVAYVLNNGTHAWPGGRKGITLAGAPSNDLQATHVLWEFFQSHPKL